MIGQEKVTTKEQGFLKGAIILSLGNFLAKVMGALFRIPLGAILGAEGVGLYQLAYPFYCLLLTVASSGLPSGISRLVAMRKTQGETGVGVLKTALKLFFIVGMGGSLCMFLLKDVVGSRQGENLASGYLALSPAVLAVALISVFRGYFQGRCNMLPTAYSELIEQGVKGSLSVLLAYVFRSDTLTAVTSVLFSVTVSEGAALLFMFLYYHAERKKEIALAPYLKELREERPSFYAILSVTVPVALAAAVLPLSQFFESRMCVAQLESMGKESVALYGLYAGGAVTLVSLPVSVCYGLAMSVIPRLQGRENQREKIKKAVLFTLYTALPCALGLILFARPLGRLFFGNISSERLDILVKLIRFTAPTAVTHALAQTLSATLIGRGKAGRAAKNMSIAVIVKLLLIFLLVRAQNMGIYGMAVAANGCYFTAFMLNLYHNFKKEEK